MDSVGNPPLLRNLIVSAINNSTGELIKIYSPKMGIIESGKPPVIGTDGMFRLFNLPGGNYSIIASYIEPITLQPKIVELIASIDVVLGADVYLKLVIPDVS